MLCRCLRASFRRHYAMSAGLRACFCRFRHAAMMLFTMRAPLPRAIFLMMPLTPRAADAYGHADMSADAATIRRQRARAPCRACRCRADAAAPPCLRACRHADAFIFAIFFFR